MDFSTLFSSGNTLYIIGAVVIVILVIELFVILSKKSPVNQAITATTIPVAPSATTETQAVTKEESVLPSTTIAETSPAVMDQNTSAVIAEPAKAVIPPLSSWKPSEVAAPIKVEEGGESVQPAPTTREEKQTV